MNASLAIVPLLCSMTLVASVAAASPDGYVQGGLIVTVQPAGTPNHRVTPALSGEAIGLAAAVGFQMAPEVAIEGEVVDGGTISTQQHFHYDWFEDFTGESRDLFVGANVRWRPASFLELIGGGVLRSARSRNGRSCGPSSPSLAGRTCRHPSPIGCPPTSSSGSTAASRCRCQ